MVSADDCEWVTPRNAFANAESLNEGLEGLTYDPTRQVFHGVRCVTALRTALGQSAQQLSVLNPWQLSVRPEHHELGFGYAMRLSPLRTVLKGERQTRQTDAHSSV